LKLLQSPLLISFQLANCVDCEPKTCQIQGRGSITLEIKPHQYPCWVYLLFVSDAPFCRSTFCLACWLLSCVVSLMWHPNILKIILIDLKDLVTVPCHLNCIHGFLNRGDLVSNDILKEAKMSQTSWIAERTAIHLWR
jgi:hypothetical protein